MKLDAATKICTKLQAACGARHRGADAGILSPLPNLRLEPGDAIAELVHRVPLEPMNHSNLIGSATLKLRDEHLHVTIVADRQVHIDLRRCASASATGEAGGGELLVVVTACGDLRPGAVSSASFQISSRADFQVLTDADMRQLLPGELVAAQPAALHGLSLRAWPASRSPEVVSADSAEDVLPTPAAKLANPPLLRSDGTYFLKRMKDEIGAALRADEASIASKHIQIATLMARHLQQVA
jgi:hypothetical protein